MKRLGVQTPVTIADDRFDDLFVLTMGSGATATNLIRLHYR